MRIFAASFLSDLVSQRIRDLIDNQLNGHAAEFRLTPLENRHLTWFFFGDIQEASVEFLKQHMRSWIPPTVHSSSLTVQISSPALFPNRRRPRVVVLPIATGVDHLQTLRDSLKQVVAACGVPFDDKPFRPHITLGYVRKGKERSARDMVLPEFENGRGAVRWEINELDLVKSTLTPQGARYATLERKLLIRP